GRGAPTPAGRAADAAAGRGSDRGGNSTPRQAGPGRRGTGDRRAALHRRAPLRGGGHSDRALRRRAALDPRSERARRQREPAARGPARRDQDRRHGGRRFARDAVSLSTKTGIKLLTMRYWKARKEAMQPRTRL